MKKRLVILAAALTVLLSGCAKAQTAWITDLAAAKADAEKSKKDLLIVFTGSDWNEESKTLTANVFTEDFFKKGSKDFVLCNIDIVQDETLMPAETQELNYNTATTYNVQGLPWLVLQTADGDTYSSAMLENVATTDAFFELTSSFAESREKFVDLRKNIKSSKGVEKAKAIDAFLDTIDQTNRANYADLIRSVPELDADNEAGLKTKYILQIAYLDAIELYKGGDMVGAGNIFVTLASAGTLDAPQTQEAWYMAAYMHAMSGATDNAQIISWLETAIAADPENAGSEQIRMTIEQLKAEEASGPDAAPVTE